MTHPSPTAVRVHDQIETLPIDALVPYARNSRTHSAEQIAQIAASIREFGFTNPVLINGTGTQHAAVPAPGGAERGAKARLCDCGQQIGVERRMGRGSAA